MNSITASFYIIIISIVLCMVLPWWIFVIPCFVAGAFCNAKSTGIFLVGFLSIFSVWGIYACWIHYSNQSALTDQIAELLKIPGGFLLLLATAFMGGLVGGLSSLSGHFVKAALD